MFQYKLLEITTIYEAYLRSFYAKNQDTEGLSYDALYQLFVQDCFADGDFVHRYLNRMGIETALIFYNNKQLQAKWKPELSNCSSFEILMAQLRNFKPDIIFISCFSEFSREQFIEMKNYDTTKKIKLVGYIFFYISDDIRRNLDLFDQIYTGGSYFIELFKKEGIEAKLLRHAFEPSVYMENKSEKRKDEIVFPGNIFVGKKVHSNRLDMLNALIECGVPWSFYGEISNIAESSKWGKIRGKICPNREQRISRLILEENKYNCYPSVFGKDYYRVLSENLICVNSHISIEWGAGNMRMFEATGMGACLLTDDRAENSEIFEVDKEIVTYSSLEEFKDKVKWLLNDTNKTKEIAKAGQEKTFKIHSYENKALALNEYLQELF